MSVKPSLETQGEKAGHRGAGKEAWNQPVASPPVDTSLAVSAHRWGPGASALGSSWRLHSGQPWMVGLQFTCGSFPGANLSSRVHSAAL